MAIYLAVAGDVFDNGSFCAVVFAHEMSWMRSGTELSQFLRIFLATFPCIECVGYFGLNGPLTQYITFYHTIQSTSHRDRAKKDK